MNKCILCDTFLNRIIQKQKLELFRCNKCGLVQLKGEIEDRKNDIYSLNYFIKKENKKTADGYSDYFKYKELKKATFLKWIDFIKRYKTLGNLLDFGCGPGFFLEVAENHGFKVFGLDVSEDIVHLLRERFPSNIFCGKLKELSLSSYCFDIVTLFDSIEHLRHPLDTLQNINRVLKKEGIVAINTPNFDSFFSKLMKANWYALLPNEHIFLFTPSSIKYLLNMTGFKILEIKPTYKILTLEYMQEKAEITSPEFSKILKSFSHLLPSKLFTRELKVKTGEMFILAQKDKEI